VKVTQSTLTNNRATSGNDGGGFVRVESGQTFAELDFMHATVARNTASGQGGGIFNDSTASATTRINASVIVLNTSGSNNVLDDLRGVIPDTSLAFHDGKNKNLFTSLPSNPRPLGYDSSLDMITTNPKIGNVANNGGPTQTIALQSGSPAIDAGLDSHVPNDPSNEHSFDLIMFPADQRGFPAPKPAHGKHDLGAFEF
jgi:hypothetical protein